jgi:hypothetical protein
MTATGHCPVPVLPRRAKTSFPGRGAAPLRFAASSAWVQKGSWAGLRAASASAATLCWRGATPPSWLARPPQQRHCPPTHATGRGRPPTTPATGLRTPPRKNRNTGTACGKPLPPLPPSVCWLAPAPGASSPDSALGVGPGCHNTSPETWTREILEAKMNQLYVPRQSWSFSRRRSQYFRDRDFPGVMACRAAALAPF